MFDQDKPGAREKATTQRVLRHVVDPGEVVICLELASTADALEARGRLLDAGVLDRFGDKTGPLVLEAAE